MFKKVLIISLVMVITGGYKKCCASLSVVDTLHVYLSTHGARFKVHEPANPQKRLLLEKELGAALIGLLHTCIEYKNSITPCVQKYDGKVSLVLRGEKMKMLYSHNFNSGIDIIEPLYLLTTEFLRMNERRDEERDKKMLQFVWWMIYDDRPSEGDYQRFCALPMWNEQKQFLLERAIESVYGYHKRLEQLKQQ